MTQMHVAHFNVARLLHDPTDPRVREFTSNTTRVNVLAERSTGFVWRLVAETVSDSGGYQAADQDPRLAISLSVWETADALRQFVHRTVHGTFLRRRAEWFEPWAGPNYVLWRISPGALPTLTDGWMRLKRLSSEGATSEAFDFQYYDTVLRTGMSAD